MDQLVLNYNKLTTLNARWFKGLEKLHVLKIRSNQIAEIDDEAFDGLEGKLSCLSEVINILLDFIRT